MEPLPENFSGVFFNNQFRTTISLPTTETYPNFQGKCAVVTGSNTGLGLEASKQLLALGLSHLIMGVRSVDKGQRAAKSLHAVNPEAKVQVWHLDMESYASVQEFARRCDEELSHIDNVILNAGLSPMSFALSPETGHEKTIQVNHLSTILLTTLLLPILKQKRAAGRDAPVLTLVNSVTAHLCKIPNKRVRPFLPSFDDTSMPWDPSERYGVSKLLCQLFIVKLASVVSPEDVVINMVDPGLTKGTGLARDAKGLLGLVVAAFFSIAGRPVDRGAATYLDAALGQGGNSHGCFLMNCKVSP
jgi:NAD(P)-dependent dehydrogenase (short-subunit alcohol dehydrogenase family)